jgi:hypothetical protein
MLRFNPVTGEVDLAPVFSQRPGPPGADGAPGLQGDPGNDGKNGRDGKEGRPGKDGKDGKDGRDGSDANTILNGLQPPQASDGIPGDFFIDVSTWTIYGPKHSNGHWPLGVCMAGQKGPAGPAGKDGKDGLNGKDGKAGANGKDGARGKEGPPGLPGKAPTGYFTLLDADFIQGPPPSKISVSVS